MRIFLIMILIFCVEDLFAQKPLIDSHVCKDWPSLGSPILSNDGQYVMYNIQNIPINSKTMVVQSTDGKWKKEFNGGLLDGYTSFNNNYLWFLRNDSLGMLSLGSNDIKYVPQVSSFWLQTAGNKEYLIYRLKNKEKGLIIKDLKTNKERSFTDVEDWNFKGNLLVLFKSHEDADKKQSMSLIDLKTEEISEIWKGTRPYNLVLDINHNQLAFKIGDSIWYYKIGSSKPLCVTNKNFINLQNRLVLGNIESFSKDGKCLFTTLIEKRKSQPMKEGVEVWSYTDMCLQPEQETRLTDQRYLAVLNINEQTIVRLSQQIGEEISFPKAIDSSDTLGLVLNYQRGYEPWSIAHTTSWSLVNRKNGQKKKLSFLDNLSVEFSSHGKYLLYYDNVKLNYFSYEIATGTIRNLTQGINVSWANMIRDDLTKKSTPRGSCYWLNNDQFVLIYDQYDIWKLDPLNREKPINITNGYGTKNRIVFNCIFGSNSENIIKKSEKLYLTAFDIVNKYNGFFRKQLDKAGDPELLNMGPYLYQTNSGYVPDGSDFSPIKAINTEMYVIRRMSVTDAPSYFSTNDFKNFTRLTNIQPQKRYNWYTTELHTWKSLDGRKLQGILYKPENFDPNKKYPVIFHYYERKSDGLNAFLQPDTLCDGCSINIPTYVSNGYLVFTPDIYFKIGDPMQGTYDAVTSAANYISALPFVMAKKIGLQGCSFGGIQTNYLITHCNLFSAAVSASSIANWVSGYGGLIGGEISQQNKYEIGQLRIGGSLWEKPEAYIKNSSIFQVAKVATPLLLMHTKNDGTCLYLNAMEFFTGLRRTGKKAWMLVYAEGNHGIWGKEADDFSIRMMQFFDHYLKDKPAPLWMLDGVNAENRNWKAGLELDITGRTPGPGLLTQSEQAKVDSLMTRKPITITLK